MFTIQRFKLSLEKNYKFFVFFIRNNQTGNKVDSIQFHKQ